MRRYFAQPLCGVLSKLPPVLGVFDPADPAMVAPGTISSLYQVLPRRKMQYLYHIYTSASVGDVFSEMFLGTQEKEASFEVRSQRYAGFS